MRASAPRAVRIRAPSLPLGLAAVTLDTSNHPRLRTNDIRYDDGHEHSPEELFSYLTRVMYNRRAHNGAVLPCSTREL